MGVVPALAEVLDAAGAPVLQPALFPAAELAGVAADGRDRAEALRKRGPGRPVGALNRRTQAFRDYVLSRGVHPVDVLIEAYSRPVHDLAKELGCTALEAHTAQMNAARVVLEYTEGKMPVRMELASEGVNLFIGRFDGAAAKVETSEYFQGVTIDDAAELNGEKSNEDG